MKKILITLGLILFPIFINAQVIDWNNFNERKMDSVMFSMMNEYVKTIHNGDYLTWSPVVQKEIMERNYNVMKRNPMLDVHKLHNLEWCNERGESRPVPEVIKSKIIKENINTKLINSKLYSYQADGITRKAYGNFHYYEILECVDGVKEGQTYQELAVVCIRGWNKSIEGHAQIMNANYQNKVIVGVVTLYVKETRRTVVSFVHID